LASRKREAHYELTWVLCASLERRCPHKPAASASTDDGLRVLLQTVITRLMKMLTRQGVLIEEMGQTHLADPDAVGEEARSNKLTKKPK
jgi:hypothetical protein